ncbi:mCG147579 [Mus musculus]|nr:mCG147579 [Mus musculus]
MVPVYNPSSGKTGKFLIFGFFFSCPATSQADSELSSACLSSAENKGIRHHPPRIHTFKKILCAVYTFIPEEATVYSYN